MDTAYKQWCCTCILLFKQGILSDLNYHQKIYFPSEEKMGIDFSIEVDEKQEIPILRIKGEIDIYTCPKLNKTLTGLIEQGHKRIILNLDQIQYIDSTGLGTIAHSARSLTSENGLIGIICTKPQVKKIFEISGLQKKNIHLFEEEKVALTQIN
jgi:anti-sigma B factor antagonist